MGSFTITSHKSRRNLSKISTLNQILTMNYLLLTVLALSAVVVTLATPIHSNVVSRETIDKDIEERNFADVTDALKDHLKTFIMDHEDILLDPNTSMAEKENAIAKLYLGYAGNMAEGMSNMALSLVIRAVLPGVMRVLCKSNSMPWIC